MSESIPQRAYGTEFEYGILINNSDDLPSAFFRHLPAGLDGIHNSAGMRTNGSRIYPDVGHAEYALPECTSLDDLVHADFAGEEIMTEACNALTEETGRSYRIHKRGVATNGSNYGAHESYTVDQSIRFDNTTDQRKNYLVQALAVHYISRMALVGAGYYDFGESKWMVSQRAYRFDVLSNFYCHVDSERPLVDTRNEPLADPDRFRRLHVSHGDPNVSPWALRNKIGMTSAYLSLLEHGVPMDDLFLYAPLKAAYSVASDVGLREKLVLANGKNIHALDLQAEIAERILTLHEREGAVPADEVAVAEDTHITATRAKQDPAELVYKSDWKTRITFAEQEKVSNARDLDEYHNKLAAADLLYDAIAIKEPGEAVVRRGIGHRLRTRGRFGEIDTDKIAALKVSPPQGSRAQLRGALLAAAEDPAVQARYGEVKQAWWDEVNFPNIPQPLELKDPFRTRPSRTMRRILNTAGIEYDG